MKRIGLTLAASLAMMTHAYALCAGTFCDGGGNEVKEFVPMNCPSGGGPCTGPSGGSPTSPTYTAIAPAATVATGQIAITSTATQVVAARTGAVGTGRITLTTVNIGSVAISCGQTSAVTATTGLVIGPNYASWTVGYNGALWCITASGTTSTASFAETY